MLVWEVLYSMSRLFSILILILCLFSSVFQPYSIALSEHELQTNLIYGTSYCSGYAACSDGENTYVIDSSGNIESTHIGYDVVDPLFVDELPFILTSNEYIIYNPMGASMILVDDTLEIKELFAFHNGLARFISNSNEQGFINVNGQVVLRGDFRILTEMYDGYAYALNNYDMWLVISFPTREQEKEIELLIGNVIDE